MKILIIEPFFTGSHKIWAEGYKKYSCHKVDILSLPGRFWKWRMHGGAMTLAKQFKKMDFQPDIIMATDMLNLPVFQSLIRPTCPVVIYFHENQFTYPWSPLDKDVELQRDKHYGFINYSSSLIADHVYFNSQYHMNSFFSGLEDFLRQFPDYREIQNIAKIKAKSSVLHLGLDLHKFDPFISKNNSDPALILWNHRWEYDKNPDTFFEIIQGLSEQGANFNLAILGKEFNNERSCFTIAREKLNKHILHFGYSDSFYEYSKWLWKADIIPVTSYQDFFGASIMEAVYCNTIPLLPKRLTYPELFQEDIYPQLFYESSSELIDKLTKAIHNIVNLRESSYEAIAINYDWSNIAVEYDRELIKLIN